MISNLSRYQARGELQVELEGTGNLAGETYQVPNAYLIQYLAACKTWHFDVSSETL